MPSASRCSNCRRARCTAAGTTTAAASRPGGGGRQQTIYDIVVGNADFSILASAIEKAGLIDVVSGEGPFTVFGERRDFFFFFLFAHNPLFFRR